MTTSLRWIASLAVATAVSSTSFAIAADEHTVDRAPKRTVRAWDLDLAKAEDVDRLYERLQSAALRICSKEASRNWQATRLHAPRGWVERCTQDAVDAAVRGVGNRRLAAVHMAPSAASTLL